MTRLCGVYCITHLETGRRYVGQSVDITRRWRSHTHRKGQGSLIGRALVKYGTQAFTFQVLELCALEILDAREIAWIAEFDCIKPNGYNLDSGGNSQKTRTDETKAKIREKALLYAATNGRSLSTRKTGGVEIYHNFEHVDGRKVTCTQWELKTYHVPDYADRATKFDASTLVAGRCDTLRGWMLESQAARIRAEKPHLFPLRYVHEDGRQVQATELEMRRQYGVDTNIRMLRKGRQHVCCGWKLITEEATQ